MKKRTAFLVISALAICANLGNPGVGFAEPLIAGDYSFSDEHGGFKLKSVQGRGTAKNPFVVVEDLISPGPVFLTVRKLPAAADQHRSLRHAPLSGMQISLVKIVVNKTGRVWVGYDLELQEELHVPSPHGDGLSFNQLTKKPTDIRADRFSVADRIFEPHDRIHFFKGHVNPREIVRFSLFITDITPSGAFYLRQEPLILFARNRIWPGVEKDRKVAVSSGWKMPGR